MSTPIDKVRGEGNCGRVTDRGEEACECVRKYRPDIAAGRIPTKAARLRTETSYKAGSTRRVTTTSRSRSQSVAQVNGELVQRKITFLSGEICRDGMRVVVAPISKACLKTRNASAKAAAGAAEVSRGRSTDPRRPIDDRKDRTMKNKEEPSANSQRGNASRQVDLDRPEDAGHETIRSLSRPGRAVAARAEQPTLSLFPKSLMEAVVDEANLETAWKNVKANRGAPGPDGVTITKFPEWFRSRWPQTRQQLLDGTYRPGPVRRKAIDKPDGGQRLLGIPNVIERLIQQAIVQVLTPIFDPHFSESSFGFRPKRSAHGAAKQVRRIIRRGYRFAADIDLSKFFDRVGHDVLMTRVARRIDDKVLLRLIGRYLRAGVMVEGVLQADRCRRAPRRSAQPDLKQYPA